MSVIQSEIIAIRQQLFNVQIETEQFHKNTIQIDKQIQSTNLNIIHQSNKIKQYETGLDTYYKSEINSNLRHKSIKLGINQINNLFQTQNTELVDLQNKITETQNMKCELQTRISDMRRNTGRLLL